MFYSKGVDIFVDEPKLTGPEFVSEEERQAYLAEIDEYWAFMCDGRSRAVGLKPMSEVTPEERKAAYRESLESDESEDDFRRTGFRPVRSVWGPVR